MYYSADYHSKLGKIQIVGNEKEIVAINFYGQKHFNTYDSIENNELAIFNDVFDFFDDYFNGKNPKINFKLKPEGTEFQKKVWKIICDIPYAKTITYGDIASKISKNMSSQAVGGAVSRNPILIAIPCHRVIGSNGNLTGYAAGIDKKTELLKIENIQKTFNSKKII